MIKIIANPDDPQQLAVEQLVRTATWDWKVQIARGAIQLLQDGQEMMMDKYDKWRIEASRTQHPTSLAMKGVPTDISEEHIIAGVMAGLRPEIDPEARGKLANISYLQKRPSVSSQSHQSCSLGNRPHVVEWCLQRQS